MILFLTFNSIMQISVVHLNDDYLTILAVNDTFVKDFLSRTPFNNRNFVQTMLSNPLGYRFKKQPLISILLMNRDKLKQESRLLFGEQHCLTDAYIDRFVNMFVMREVKRIPQCDYFIPKHNLFHAGEICHLNVCINVLSSLWHLVNHINSINPQTLSDSMTILKEIIFNSYSQIDMNMSLIYRLINILGVNPREHEWADETMTKIMKIIYEITDINFMMYWDSRQLFVPQDEKDINVHQFIDNHHPKYLLLNNQDFNFECNVESIDEFQMEYTTEHYQYRLSSLILHLGAHFISAFRTSDDSFELKDDLFHRLGKVNHDLSQMMSQISVCCYVRLDKK